eukprot:6294769-Lingulodinium_polyedra.AAC.1
MATLPTAEQALWAWVIAAKALTTTSPGEPSTRRSPAPEITAGDFPKARWTEQLAAARNQTPLPTE